MLLLDPISQQRDPRGWQSCTRLRRDIAGAQINLYIPLTCATGLCENDITAACWNFFPRSLLEDTSVSWEKNDVQPWVVLVSQLFSMVTIISLELVGQTKLKTAQEWEEQKICPAQVLLHSPHPSFLEARQEWSMREIRPNDCRGVTSGVQWGKCLENQIHKMPLFLITTWSRSRWNSQKMTNFIKENGYNLIIYKVNCSLKSTTFSNDI